MRARESVCIPKANKNYSGEITSYNIFWFLYAARVTDFYNGGGLIIKFTLNSHQRILKDGHVYYVTGY